MRKAVSHIVIPSGAEGSLPFAVRDSRVPHMCRALLRFSHLSFIPLEPYPARFARHLPHAGKAYDTGYAFLSFVFMLSRVLLLLAIPQSRFPVCKEDFSLRSK